jgi:hypothetical protein
MISIDEYQASVIPHDPEMSFIHLESKYRAVLDKKLEGIDQSSAFNFHVIEYMNHTYAASRALDLHLLEGWEIPSHSARHGVMEKFNDFTTAIDHFKVQVLINRAQVRHQYSVALTSDEKDKLRNYVNEIKNFIGKSSLSQNKKDRLYNKLNAFLAEVDRDRTRLEVFSDMSIAIAHVGGEVAKELEPVRKLIDSISRLIGRNMDESALGRTLPKPTTKKLPPPKKESNGKRDDTDDEIPF